MEGGNISGKRPLGRSSRRWEDNNRMDLKEMDVNISPWIDSGQDRYSFLIDAECCQYSGSRETAPHRYISNSPEC